MLAAPLKFAARKIWTRSLVALVGTALHSANGDLVVVQKVEGGGQSGEQTIRIKDDRARCDVGSAFSLLVDRKNAVTTTLSHPQKGYLTISPERAAAMLEQMRKARGSDETPTLVDTGKAEKLGNYQCEIFTSDLGAVKVSYWLAKAYPNFPALLAQMDVVESNPLSGATSRVALRTKDLPGMPMKIVMEKGGQKVTVTLISAREEPVDPAIFKIPDDYQELHVAPPPGAK